MKNILDLTGKTGIVTGGGSGIGESISRLLAEHGARIIILDLDIDKADKVAEEICSSGGSAIAMSCNVVSYDQVDKVMTEAVNGSGLDILVNNAGIAHIGTIETTTPEDMDRIYSVNVKGVFHCLKKGVELMKENGGVIVNMASVASLTGIPDRFAYSMSKGAVNTMTLSVARDCLKYKIRCNSIAPARIHTPFVDGFLSQNYPGNEKEMFEKLSDSQPVGRMGQPSEVAALTLFLCSDQAKFITGTCYPLDGGFLQLNH